MDREKYIDIKKMTENPFLNLYDVTSRKRTGEVFHYYFASRGDGPDMKCHTRKNNPEGVMVYAVCRQEPEKIVLVKQYRYPINDFVYEMPAGLVDPGESLKKTAVREFFEETGMKLTLYEGGEEALRNPFYTTVGLTDESVSILYGYAEGTPSDQNLEASEDMEVILADKEEAKRILREEKTAMKCAQSLIHFIQSSPGDPFAFLRFE